MSYKDKRKQKETTKERVRRYRQRQKALQETTNDVTPNVTPNNDALEPVVDSGPSIMPEAVSRVRPYSKEQQLKAKASKAEAGKQVKFEQLKAQFDYRIRQ